MSGELYRLAIVLVCLIGMGAGGFYLWLYKPTRWRDAWQRDASAWVLVLVLVFGWSLYRVGYAIVFGPAPERVPLAQAVSGITLGLLLDAVVVYRLHRFRRAARFEQAHPTQVCPRCGGRGLVPLDAGSPP